MYYSPEFFYDGDIFRQMSGMPGFSTVYVVRPGDTLGKIAGSFNTTVEMIARVNNIENPDLIYPGQRLVIPRMPIQPMPALPVLRPGDRGIYVIFLQRLLLANGYDIGVIDGNFGECMRQAVIRLQRDRGIPVTGMVGRRTWQTLIEQAPEIVRPPAAPIVYTVEPGDTLYSIAARYNISLQLLIATNRLENPDLIYPGMRIIIPLQ
ncbi:LysM peptidoglycan-binding domain-containing protein [Herbivorax sp. ANBcel31]|uniref:LysM peptidoglycan-binding domain-containing protein n=1 Tax=Herbivorax sp. ANBcel31 TaxID=3069754 RepID=UPI0027B74705|nr:LysM peptidoglycan-binding domain-containing protein [Herbivorax sp. ANBcel31]MDQ2086537.1 LysM peptidoglycan-binding domain-containing protein [Herbivorax sp. ANBcel31]